MDVPIASDTFLKLVKNSLHILVLMHKNMRHTALYTAIYTHVLCELNLVSTHIV